MGTDVTEPAAAVSPTPARVLCCPLSESERGELAAGYALGGLVAMLGTASPASSPAWQPCTIDDLARQHLPQPSCGGPAAAAAPPSEPVCEIREYYDADGRQISGEAIDLRGAAEASFSGSEPSGFVRPLVEGCVPHATSATAGRGAKNSSARGHEAAMSCLDELIADEERQASTRSWKRGFLGPSNPAPQVPPRGEPATQPEPPRQKPVVTKPQRSAFCGVVSERDPSLAVAPPTIQTTAKRTSRFAKERRSSNGGSALGRA